MAALGNAKTRMLENGDFHMVYEAALKKLKKPTNYVRFVGILRIYQDPSKKGNNCKMWNAERAE